jgi:hypothetical protein
MAPKPFGSFVSLKHVTEAPVFVSRRRMKALLSEALPGIPWYRIVRTLNLGGSHKLRHEDPFSLTQVIRFGLLKGGDMCFWVTGVLGDKKRCGRCWRLYVVDERF